MKTNSLSNKLSKGFTLIELLIVMAVLGVLAAIVLVAIDPAEQLKRGRDASRLQAVAQLGHAMQAYVTTQNTPPPLPATGNGTWQTTLKNSGDISAVQTAAAGGAVCAPPVSAEGSICYSPSGTDFVIWTGVESKQYVTKAAGAAACGSGKAYFIYSSTQGKAGVACSSDSVAPGVATPLL